MAANYLLPCLNSRYCAYLWSFYQPYKYVTNKEIEAQRTTEFAYFKNSGTEFRLIHVFVLLQSSFCF